MFKQRSGEKELMDDLELSNNDLRKNLDELEFINYWLGGNKVITQALSTILQHRPAFTSDTLQIADLGCGGGDILREVARWCIKKNIKAQLTGIDTNPFMVTYAREKCCHYRTIQVKDANIFSSEFKQERYDISICSLFCHHFTDQELVQLLQQFYKQTRMAIIINDLHRHPLAYYSIKWLTKIFSGSYLVKNDAPLSVLRAFKRTELHNLLQQAGFSDYRLRWQWAFRWQIIIYKNL